MQNLSRFLPLTEVQLKRAALIALCAAAMLIPTSAFAAKPSKPTPTPTQTCYKPLGVTTDISGYLEGSISKKGNTSNGKEIVYDLMTFQRITFSTKVQYPGSVSNGGDYVGTISGFQVNSADSTDYTQFRSQYDNVQMNYNSEPADAPIWQGWSTLTGSQGTVHFSTASDQTPVPQQPISGDDAYLTLARRSTFTSGLTGRGIAFAVFGSLKSYIANCLVDTTSLVNDIRSGNGSPATFSTSDATWRDAAANAAQAAADDYNHRVQFGEPTATPSATPTFVPPQ